MRNRSHCDTHSSTSTFVVCFLGFYEVFVVVHFATTVIVDRCHYCFDGLVVASSLGCAARVEADTSTQVAKAGSH